MDRAFYDRYAQLQDRHWWFVGRRRIIAEQAQRVLGARAGAAQILDVGCGTGTMLAELSRLGTVRGTEAEQAAVDHCQRRGFGEVALASGPPLPYPDASFDLVTILDVLEHLDDDAAMVAEIRRLLRPGAAMIATVPAYPALWGPQDEISHHRRRYTRTTLTNAIQAGDLRLRRLTAFNTILFPPIAAIRLLRPRRRQPRSDFELTPGGGPINTLLARLFAAEARWLAHRNLPVGVSLMAVAER